MPRSPTTTDAFTAIAEPQRRRILNVFAQGQDARDVSSLVDELGWPQPQVSKHLGVLREVGLVTVVREGKRRMYSLNAEMLRPVYDWVKNYERFWAHHLQRIKERAERIATRHRGNAHRQPERNK